MSSGLAFGASQRAGQRLKRSQAGIDIFQSGQRTEEAFERAGEKVQRGSNIGALTLGTGLSLLGMAALSAVSGGAALPLLGKMIVAGGATKLGSAIGAKIGAKKSGIEQLDERFHRRDIRRGKEDVRQFIREESTRKGVGAAKAVGALGGFDIETDPKDLLDFIKRIFDQGGQSFQGAGPSNLPGGAPFNIGR